ncbi:hypothetical protein [Lacticaseibacillus suibinensis]|uniref:hypothetical protein n=1 Tax=Lacticaseibacillus suibinensis TaxID=2486011 RepID=UPI000F786C05|nr:hypothetical protein [Lacticaseibacillus suibinensis]
MTIAEMARAWGVPIEEIRAFLHGVTISKKDPRTDADLIPWADVAAARDYFWLNRKNATQDLD